VDEGCHFLDRLSAGGLKLVGSLSEDLEFRGLIHQVTDPELPARLDADHLTAYTGFDPTADSLHVGHLLQLCNLRRLQLGGHRPIAVAGGGTAVIGDPGGKSEERVLLDDAQIKQNLEGVRPQLEKLLDFSDGAGATKALLVDNGDWLHGIGILQFLRDVGKHFTVNQMVAKESVRARFERPDQGISFTEFSYMLLQAYDFLQLFDTYGCTLQLGGSDQWGNITTGIELIRKVRRAEAFGLTTPLILKADGTKFGKTESGTVWLDAKRTSPYQLYQFFLRAEDSVVCDYLRRLTFLDHDTIRQLDSDTEDNPGQRLAQKALAREMCVLVHGAAEADRAEMASAALFSEEISNLDEQMLLDVFAEVPTSTMARSVLEPPGLSVVEALVEVGLCGSRNQARTAIDQGGAYVNNRRVASTDAPLGRDDLLWDRYVVLRRGRRDYHLVQFG
jgi:tyrosyl-tRNA synthetase